jgi:hypothetical protein
MRSKAEIGTDLRDFLSDNNIPSDVIVYVDAAGKRATASFGDWHEQDVWDKTNRVLEDYFENYEIPDDSEIGAPEWAELSVTARRTKSASTAPAAHHRYLADDDDAEEYSPVGLDGLLAASEKLLAVNRGLAEPDERDALPNDRIYTPDKLLAERVKLDTGKVLRQTMGRLSRARSLKPMGAGQFSPYTIGYITSNPLVPALEEINPVHILEQKRRITKMGPGGIGDPNAITLDMQSVHVSQFGFVDPIHGPECFDDKTEVYTWGGWKPWPSVTLDDFLACRVGGRLEFHKPERLVSAHYTGPLIVAEHSKLRIAVTPNHRVLNLRDGAGSKEHVNEMRELEGKQFKIPIRHLPLLGDEAMTAWELPEIPLTNSNQKVFGPLDICDWAEFLGWWLSEGSSNQHLRVSRSGKRYTAGYVRVSQCPCANPDRNERIRQLMIRLGFIGRRTAASESYLCSAAQLRNYFAQWKSGCCDKWLPDEVFTFPVAARERLLEALLLGAGRLVERRRECYRTVSKRLAESVERLAVSLGRPAFIRQEPDSREHATTTNYVVSISRKLTTQVTASRGNWAREDYCGLVYCATVPGGLLLVRGKPQTRGHWSGNSERAGVDVRLSYGARVGSDGKIYQLLLDRRSGKKRWVSMTDLRGKTLKLPD